MLWIRLAFVTYEFKAAVCGCIRGHSEMNDMLTIFVWTGFSCIFAQKYLRSIEYFMFSGCLQGKG